MWNLMNFAQILLYLKYYTTYLPANFESVLGYIEDAIYMKFMPYDDIFGWLEDLQEEYMFEVKGDEV